MQRPRPMGRAAPLPWSLLALIALYAGLALAILAGCEGPAEGVLELPGVTTPYPGPSDADTDEIEAPSDALEDGEDAQPAAPSNDAETEGDEDAQTVNDDAETQAASGGPLPDDMLSPQEGAAASDIALEAASGMLAAATDRDAIGATADLGALAEMPTYRVMYSQRYDGKDTEERSAEVAFYRYDTNEVVLTRVGLESEAVLPLSVPPGYMAPLLPQEIAEAARVARQDDDVRVLLADSGLDPDTARSNGLLTVMASQEEHPCATSRCVRLFFFGEGEGVVPTFMVIVDLSALEVVEIAPMEVDEAPADAGPDAAVDETEAASDETEAASDAAASDAAANDEAGAGTPGNDAEGGTDAGGTDGASDDAPADEATGDAPADDGATGGAPDDAPADDQTSTSDTHEESIR